LREFQSVENNMKRGLNAVARVLMLVFFSIMTSLSITAAASAETRTLKIYHVHTGEKVEITFKRNGRYLQDGLNKLNRALRDWRRNEPTKMDPRLMDTVWEVYQKSGSRGYISVVGGYRSPATNSMLRKRSKGVAEKSQHMKGKAMDFFIPGVSLKKLRYLGLQQQAGGVGYYPRSGSPFVHLDVGSVRHWPRMSRSELMAPLAGYNVALASYKNKLRTGSSTAIDSGSGGSGARPRSLLAALFGGGADEDEDTGAAEEPVVAKSKTSKKLVTEEEVVEPVQRPAPKPAKEILVAALPQRTSPAPLAVVRPSTDVGTETEAPVEALAFAVPVPSKRPRLNPVLAAPSAEAALAARLEPAEAATVQMASADPQGEAEAIRASLGAQAPVPQTEIAVDATPFFAGSVPVPVRKPEQHDELMVASVAVPAPRPILAASDGLPRVSAVGAAVAEERILVASAEPKSGTATTESELRKLLSEQDGVDPATVSDTGVKTTDKGAKPKAADAKRARKPVAVPVDEDLSKFALAKEPVTSNGKEVTGLTYAQNSVWNAPTEVYVAGFSADAPKDVNKFTGKAVNFLKVAKFKKAN
jgi:uncharacterized protein YcbK (DUF882 family)